MSPWRGYVLAVVPARPGYVARSQCFRGRFTGCQDLGVLHDRTSFAQRVGPATSHDINAVLDSSVLLLLQEDATSAHLDAARAVEEIHARIAFPWLLEHEPRRHALAVVGGRPNLVSFLAIQRPASALGIDLVVLDKPGHWLSDNETHRHLRKAFVPLDTSPNDTLPERIAAAVRSYTGHVDGICTFPTALLAPVARAAGLLGMHTQPPDAMVRANDKYETRLIAGGAEPTTRVTDVSNLHRQIADKSFVPRYPLIVKPDVGWGSHHVYKADSEASLVEAVRRISSSKSQTSQRVLVEAYVDGPELDINIVLHEGDILFFELGDDFPSPGDSGVAGIDADFWESVNVLPSALPTDEYAVVRESMHALLLKLGLQTGVFHLEARVRDSSMEYAEISSSSGALPLLDLRRRQTPSSASPQCFLIEVNPRPPGFQCIPVTEGVYGVNLYELHMLSCVSDWARFRALSEPFQQHHSIPNNARAWSELIWLRADKGGVCSSDDVCGDFIERCIEPKDRAMITQAVCFFKRGDKVPDPTVGEVVSGAFFVVTSRASRENVLRVSSIVQTQFGIPVE